jgi:hypothetical protein
VTEKPTTTDRSERIPHHAEETAEAAEAAEQRAESARERAWAATLRLAELREQQARPEDWMREATSRAASATRAADAARIRAVEANSYAARAYEEAARTQAHAAEVAEKYGGNIDAPVHRRAAADAREQARRAWAAAGQEARTSTDPSSPP